MYKLHKMSSIKKFIVDEFPLTLISNVDSFSENSMTQFRTKLPIKQNLGNNWEVGLKEISFTKSWYNLTENQEIFLYSSKYVLTNKSIYVPAGDYNDIENLLTMINGKLEFFKDKVNLVPHFSYVNYSKKVLMVFGKDNDGFKVNVRLGSELQCLLGFRNKDYTSHYSLHGRQFDESEEHTVSQIYETDSFAIEASTPIDLKGGIYSLLIYTDIVQPNIVGNKMAQLLEHVSIPNSAIFGDVCKISEENPIFKKLLLNEFETINIHIKDDSGLDIKFLYGRVTLKLIFRKWMTTM